MTVRAARISEKTVVAFAHRPIGFLLVYVRRHLIGHAVVLLSVITAVGCSVGSQYAVKHLVDVLGRGPGTNVWWAFGLLTGLITADNLTWRIGGWAASHAFVRVTGDIRRDLFRHLTGHSPSYFADRLPGMLASRISATAQASYTVESAAAWSVLPPMLAVAGSILMLLTVNAFMAGVLVFVSLLLALVIMRLAQRGGALHHAYAAQAAAVDGELVDVLNNMPLVRAFGATLRERERFSRRVDSEVAARGRSLRNLERLRLLHAVATAILSACLLAWALLLWQAGQASTGDVVLVVSLGFTVLHGTRDMAVALADSVQHVARLSEALSTLLLPHELTDAADARPLEEARGAVEFRHVNYAYPESHPVLIDFGRSQQVPLVGLDYKDQRPDALKYLQQHGDPYDLIAFDQDGRVGIDYGVYGVPETYIIDKNGVIRHKHTGPISADDLRLEILPLRRDAPVRATPLPPSPDRS